MLSCYELQSKQKALCILISPEMVLSIYNSLIRADNILNGCLISCLVCGNVHSLLPLYSCHRFGISFWFVCTLPAHICIAFYLRVSGIVAALVVVVVAAVAVARSSLPLHLPCAIYASWSDTSTLYFRYFFSISLAFPLAVISIFVLPWLCCSPINIFVEHAILRCLHKPACSTTAPSPPSKLQAAGLGTYPCPCLLPLSATPFNVFTR